MMVGKLLRLGLGAALALVFLWLILRQVRPEDIKRALTSADIAWVACAVLAFGAGFVCRIERWRLMLVRENPILQWRDCAGPLLAGFAGNNVLPFRAGDLIRAFAFGRVLGITSGVALATLFVERLLDLIMILILLSAALAIFGTDAARLADVGSVALLALAAAISFVLLFPALFAPCLNLVAAMVVRAAPKLGAKIKAEVDKSLITLRQLAQGHTMLKLMLWSLATWVAEGFVFWFAAAALASITAPQAAWLALPVSTLATLIPSTPGYVGTFDYFIVRSMTELGNSAASATAYALLVHAILWLPPTLAGGLYLLLRPVKVRGRLAVSGS
jgi:glycosyltransferase 2 family protein